MLGANLFVVLSGHVGIYQRNTLIARCGVGDAFGEMALLNRKPRNATCAALSDVTVFTLDEKQLNAILEQRVAVRVLLNIVHVLSERLECANAAVTEMREG